ncbi:hypothetical protein B296_00042455 [Ensete ventricosum]|uniref:Uncharacterized protein n=1 Tax=Ensete ventricosum TaxID=4639 RepID=A0A426Y161_ENSVE|nr:hypothetical protein B296_00042455 [Ensete ventricosum]
MKADHDLDTAVTEGSLAVIRERYSIPVEYGLHVPQPGQRPIVQTLPACSSDSRCYPRGRLGELRGMPVESEEGGASPVHRRLRSMKDLFNTKVEKDDIGYYTLLMYDLGHQDPEKEMKARWKGLKNSTKVWNNSSAAEEFERGLLHPQLEWELYTLP